MSLQYEKTFQLFAQQTFLTVRDTQKDMCVTCTRIRKLQIKKLLKATATVYSSCHVQTILLRLFGLNFTKLKKNDLLFNSTVYNKR